MFDLFIETIFNMGYLGFFLYMIIVGTFVPLPTQLILLPAGFLVSQGKLDASTTVLITTMGTTIGATINYFMANYISMKFVPPEKVAKVQKFFQKYGKLSVILAPLTLGMGQYISLPAGIAKMDLRWFIPLIFLSNAIWNSMMLTLGYIFGEDADSHLFYIGLGGMLLVIAVISRFVYKELKSY